MIFFIVALLAVFCALAQALDYNCPSSGSSIHAGCQTKVVFQNGCDIVQSEIKNRISAQASGKWRDPHNNGTYTLISDTVDLFQVSRLTGDGKYTDKINFAFGSDSAQVACTMFACSESQVFSISDYGTNFCNLHDLYCNEAGCNSFYKLTYTEQVGKCTKADASVCTAK